MPEAPDNLKWNLNLRLAPDTENVPADVRGRPVASESVLWVGDPDEGRPYLDHVLSLCKPVAVSRRVAVLPRPADHGGRRVPARPPLLHQIWLLQVSR